MNRNIFFNQVKSTIFGGRLSQTQVDGMNKILDYRIEKWPRMPDNELCYLLATAKHESGHTMQPITERGSSRYLRAKSYWPWIGRGIVQITWKINYDKFGIKNPDDALKWPVALDIAFRGMIFGMFTGVKLGDCHTESGDGFDEMKARSIIQGKKRKSDPYAAQAEEVAVIYRGFYSAMVKANKAVAPEIDKPEPGQDDAVPTDEIAEKPVTGKSITQSSTAGAAAAAGVAGAAKPTAEIIKEIQGASEAGKGVAEFITSVGPWVLVIIVIAAATWWIIRERQKKSQEEGI